jgi:AraC-like DNA-binding protein
VHFVPVGCQVLYYTAVAFIPSIIHTQAGGVPIWRLVSLIEQLGGNLSMLIYSWFSLSLLLNLPGKIGSGSKLSIKSFDTLRILMSIFVLLWVAWFIYTMVDILFFQYELPLRAYYPLYLLVAVLTYTIGTVGYLHPPLIIALDAERPGTENKKNHSYLHEEDILKKLHVLQKTMQEQKLYRNPELTLAMFSSETGIGANVISFIINNRVGQSFTDWVNTFRVEEVKQLLVDPQFENLNLAGIAANAGFNSKATFNRVFKKLIGQTPTEYLESQRGQ